MWRPKLIGYDDQFGGLQCILVDQMANAIQATVKEIDYDLIGTKIKAGCIYEITHFHSARSKTSHKVVPHAAHLFFNTRTVFTELSSVYPQIPRHRFYFLDYGQLATRIDKNEILTDVLGHITAVQPLEEKMVGNGRLETKCEIYIQNVRKEDVRITLWGDTARAFDFQALEELAPPIITIFTSLKVKQFQGKTVLNSSMSTMIFIDPDIQELEAYKMTFGAFANAIRMVPPSSIQPIKPEELETAKKLSVQELNVLDPDLSKAHVFKSSYRCAAFLANYDTNYSVEVRFGDGQYDLPPWSISILPDCKNAVYNTARLGAQSSQMKMTPVNNALSWQSFTEETASSYDPDTFTLDGLRDQINMTWDSTDYLWYMTDITISPDEGFLESGQSPLLTIGSAGHALHVFINGQLSGTAYGSLEKRRLRFSDNVKLRSGVNKLALLSVSLGLPNIGIHFETWNVGVLGPVTLRGLNSGTWDLSQRKWTYRVGLKGEALSLHTVNGSSSVEWVQKPYLAKKPPLTWYKATFDAPSGNDPLALDMVSMGKGQIWINGRSIGRHWPAYTAHGACRDCYYAGTYNENKCRTKCGEPSQRWYHVPRGWLNPSGNLLVVFEEWGGEPTKIALVQRATSSVCADIFEGQPTLQSSQKLASAKLIKAKAHLRCQPGQIISDIKFASYGWPQGTCGSFKEGSCHAHKSYDFPRRVCIGKQFCTIPVAPAYFGGDPCPGSAKKFSVEAVCS